MPDTVLGNGRSYSEQQRHGLCPPETCVLQESTGCRCEARKEVGEENKASTQRTRHRHTMRN